MICNFLQYGALRFGNIILCFLFGAYRLNLHKRDIRGSMFGTLRLEARKLFRCLWYKHKEMFCMIFGGLYDNKFKDTKML